MGEESQYLQLHVAGEERSYLEGQREGGIRQRARRESRDYVKGECAHARVCVFVCVHACVHVCISDGAAEMNEEGEMEAGIGTGENQTPTILASG